MANEKTRITTFGKFFIDSMQSEGISDRYVINRKNFIKDAKASNEVVPECKGRHLINWSNWLSTLKENKTTESIIDQVPSDELPECEQLDAEHSKVGDFISKDIFEDAYDDDNGEILEGLKEDGILCFCWNSALTWWKRKQDKDGDGLVRIK